jgi:hypothetical protein
VVLHVTKTSASAVSCGEAVVYWILSLTTLCSFSFFLLIANGQCMLGGFICVLPVLEKLLQVYSFLSSSWLLQFYVYVCCEPNARH